MSKGGWVRVTCVAVALTIAVAANASAQVAKSFGVVDANTIAEKDLAALPNMTPAIAKAVVAKRPFNSITELNAIRGVTSSANQVKSLLERELILPAGRKMVVGRPMTYVTAQKFLLHFGLNSLNDLPRLSDFGEGNLEAQALAQLEPALPQDGLFAGIDE